jgi:catechol 2,3-dioxygenase-like lactoylglutathione lyase family enzyme
MTLGSTDASGIIGRDSLPLTDDPTTSRMVLLRSADGTAGTVALLWYDRPPLPSARGNLMGMGTGDVILVFQVPDIEAVFGRLDAAGSRFHQPPVPFTGRETGSSQSGRRMLVYDPDGHMVEITQLD